jgi:hypothetical protein
VVSDTVDPAVRDVVVVVNVETEMVEIDGVYRVAVVHRGFGPGKGCSNRISSRCWRQQSGWVAQDVLPS